MVCLVQFLWGWFFIWPCIISFVFLRETIIKIIFFEMVNNNNNDDDEVLLLNLGRMLLLFAGWLCWRRRWINFVQATCCKLGVQLFSLTSCLAISLIVCWFYQVVVEFLCHSSLPCIIVAFISYFCYNVLFSAFYFYFFIELRVLVSKKGIY